MQFGNKIYELRKKNGITQEQLAGELGVSTAAVSKWENNASLPDLGMLCSVADYFQVTTDSLLGREGRLDFFVADDSDFMCETLKELIEKEGYICGGIFHDGESLLEAVKERQPAGVFLDIHMPGMDGLTALNKIKAHYPAVKVAMITANPSDKVREQAIKSGADLYVTKPFLPHYITAALKDMC